MFAPQPLQEQHHHENFDCGNEKMNLWLQHYALRNQTCGASRVFVCVDEMQHIQGYYALAAAEILHKDTPGNLKRNMPNPIPAVVLGRLAVNLTATRQGLGRGLLRDAFLRAQQAAEHIGIRAMVVHAINDEAKAFYMQYGFRESPIHPLTLITPLSA
nr:GNAT family N-acetyltransferase [uncultured Cardiobacterium sp.]